MEIRSKILKHTITQNIKAFHIAFCFVEFMNEVLRYIPLNPLSPSREQGTEGTCPATPLCA